MATDVNDYDDGDDDDSDDDDGLYLVQENMINDCLLPLLSLRKKLGDIDGCSDIHLLPKHFLQLSLIRGVNIIKQQPRLAT